MALDKGLEKIFIASDRQELVDRLLDPEEEIKGIILHEVIGLVELFLSAYNSDLEKQEKEDV